MLKNSLQLSMLPVCIRRFIDPDSYKRELFILECANETKYGGLILDAGAGECQYKKFFTNHTYVGIDLGIGQQDWNYHNLDVISNLENLPFKDNSFDSILCIQVLEHVKEPLLVLQELNRVLKNDGQLYLSVPQGWCVHQAPYDFYRYTNYGIHYLLDKSHFTVDYIKETTGYFGYLANRLLFFPKIIFWSIRNVYVRLLLLPFEVSTYIILVLVLPIILNMLDPLDSKKEFTLNYLAKARKVSF